MSILDGVRAAVLGTAAARTGYLQGEHTRQDEERRDQMQDSALQRQSRLDQMKAALDAATQDRERAQADYYRSRAANPTQPKVPAPIVRQSGDGMVQWDPQKGDWVPSTLKPPVRASDRAAVRAEKKEKVQGTKDALAGVDRQISDARRDVTALQSDYETPAPEKQSRLSQLRARLDSLSGVSDSLNAELKVPGSGSSAVRPRGGTGGPPPTPTKKAPSAADQDYAHAATVYKAALAQAKTPAERAEAKQLYDKAVARLARVHGQMK